MIALLPADRDMRIAGVAEGAVREIRVRAFRFLETQDVGLVFREITGDEIDPAGEPN